MSSILLVVSAILRDSVTGFLFVWQDRLYAELQNVCGDERVTEDHLAKLPYLGAVFHETLRKHSPAPIVPLRHVDEDTQVGGYHIPAGSEVLSNSLCDCVCVCVCDCQ